MSRKSIRTALALGGAGMVAVLALAGAGSASASELTIKNDNIPPGQEVCLAAAATTSFAAAATAQAPLKFRLIAQDGTVELSNVGTTFAPYIYPGAVGWDGPGDYTVCAKNNGTQTVLLNYLTVQGN